MSKDIANKVKRQLRECDKVFANHTYDKGLEHRNMSKSSIQQ